MGTHAKLDAGPQEEQESQVSLVVGVAIPLDCGFSVCWAVPLLSAYLNTCPTTDYSPSLSCSLFFLLTVFAAFCLQQMSSFLTWQKVSVAILFLFPDSSSQKGSW